VQKESRKKEIIFIVSEIAIKFSVLKFNSSLVLHYTLLTYFY